MKFSICLPATRASTVGFAIRSVQAQSVEDWELIVIGQGDATEVRAVVSEAQRHDSRVRWTYISQSGSSRARNAGLRAANGELVAMLDDDCEAAPDWLATLASYLDGEAEIGLVGGALIAPPAARRGPGNCPSLVPSESVYDPVHDGMVAPPGWDWVTANVAFRRQLLQQVGFLDESLGPGSSFASCEDTDFKLRFERAGVRMRTTPRARVLHRFGWRYGLRAVLRHQKNYARGNGAMAAKLTLMGEPRGLTWWQAMREECLTRWYRRRQPAQLPAGLRRWYYFSGAYRECLREYRVDPSGLLAPVARTANGVPLTAA